MTLLDAATPVHSRKASKLDGTPIPGWVRESRDKGLEQKLTNKAGEPVGAPKEIQVPASKADHLASLIRQAATREGLGARVESPFRVGPNGSVFVKFSTAPKRASKPKE